ncbi:MAG: hypothetical protein H0X22_00560 [Acidimicrobiia bacterium]|nr:hypothetical protein [Acidimicrobiia bacterium]
MRRGVMMLAASTALIVAAAACSADRVSNVSSENLVSDSTTPTTPTSSDGTISNSIPPGTITLPPELTNPSTPSTGSGGTASTSLPGTDSTPLDSTPGTVDVEVPPNCDELPDGAPSIIVADNEGVVYQVGSDGTQIIADSKNLPANINSAWRAEGGALWVTLDASLAGGASIGRLDAAGYTEIATGTVNVQHVGTIDDVPVALWFEYGSATSEGRAVIEDADGNQTELLDRSSEGIFSIATGGLGGNGAVINEESSDGERFRFFDGAGVERTDWFNPTDANGSKPGPPKYTAATPSPDGERLSWLEEPVSDPATGELTGERNLVVASTDDGTESFRLRIGEPSEFVTTSDYDGQWYLVTLSGGTRLIDTMKSGEGASLVPCIPAGSATLDRGGGGGSDPPPSTPPPTTPPPTTAPPTTVPPTTTVPVDPDGTVPGGTGPVIDP